MADFSVVESLFADPHSPTENLNNPLCDDPTPPEDASVLYARDLLQSKIRALHPPVINLDLDLNIAKTIGKKVKQFIPINLQDPVVIIGAGVGGLYAAMILKSLEIPYQVLEASGRTGGRVFTHKFCEEDHQEKKKCDCDYFDVGAMRFPEIPSMNRLFHLFNYEGLNSNGYNLRECLACYKPKHDNNFFMFNRVRHQRHDLPRPPRDPFNHGIEQGGNIEPYFIQFGSSELISEGLTGFFDVLKRNPPLGLAKLSHFDQYSLRGYMAGVMKLPLHVINWCETNPGTFDQSLLQQVLYRLPFVEGVPHWCRLKGGSQVLTDHMTGFICGLPGNDLHVLQLNKAVTAIKPAQHNAICITVADESTLQCQHVISTLPMTCLRTLDIDECIDFEQRNAINLSQVEPAVKIGVKFHTAWWKEELNIKGGQSSTDLSLANVVYPPSCTDSTTLIATYTSSQNALVIGSLIGSGDVADQVLKKLVLRDLAVLHNVECSTLEKQYKSHFAFDWSHNPLSRGAWASFGPGQFSTLFRALTRPAAGGRLHFAGEAASIRHSWIVGALDTSWRAVAEILLLSHPEKIPRFLALWGRNPEYCEDGDPKLLISYLAACEPTLFDLGGNTAADTPSKLKDIQFDPSF